MMRSLYSGVSGLRNHQTRMDVIGNNISNVNTAGFKASRVIFQDVYSQTSRSAAGPQDALGGTNPVQIGLGVTLAAIDVLHTPSSTQRTDNPLDLAINGEGFFIVQTGDDEYGYTRAGNFYIDEEDYLVNANGYRVMVEGGTEGIQIPEEEYDSISVDKYGWITGISLDDADAGRVEIARISLATFTNPQGLEKIGSSLYVPTTNSGEPQINFPTEEGAGEINPGGLEMSNVDLAGEFTDMIVTQRGFQANSRIITVSDTMLEELVNLKR